MSPSAQAFISRLSHAGLAAYLRPHAVRIDEQLHPQVLPDRALALRLGQPAHGVEVVGLDPVEVVLRLGVDHPEHRVGVGLSMDVRDAPVVARDRDRAGLALPAGALGRAGGRRGDLSVRRQHRRIRAGRDGRRSGRALGLERLRDRAGEYCQPSRAAAHQPAHLVLLPRRAADDERRGARRLRRGDLGAVLRLPGLQRPGRLDAHLDRRGRGRRVRRDGREEGRTVSSTGTAREERPLVDAANRRPLPDGRRDGDEGRSRSTARTTGPSCARRTRSGSASG